MSRHLLCLLLGVLSLFSSSLSIAQAVQSHPTWPSPFGIGASHVNQRNVNDLQRWLPRMVSAGAQNIRTVNAPWHELEPRPGQWSWTHFDQQMAYLQTQGVSFDLLMWGNPGWNPNDSGLRLPVRSLPAWSNYVTQVARRAQGRATSIEVWNEPPNGTGIDQTPADYARLVVATARAAKAVNPNYKIGLAAKSAHVHYLEAAIVAGAKDHFDYIVLHPYESLDATLITSASDRVYLNIAPAVRRMLAKHNPAKQNVPIIFTELGVSSRKGESVQADGVVKAYVMGIAQGVANIQWFEGMDGDSGPLGLMRAGAVPRPAYYAFASLVTHLGSTPRFVGRVPLTSNATGYIFQGPGGPVAVAWSAVGSAATRIPVALNSMVYRPAERTAPTQGELILGPSPMIVVNPPVSWVTAAARYPAGTRLPAEDFSRVREVSLSFDGRPVSNGIHTLASADVSAAVSGYGGNVRSGRLPGGSFFVVDPSFITHTAGPIEISVVVRRNASNANAGFNLEYETLDQAGLKRHVSGWYTVPPGRQWHTRTWRVNDASFVNFWGYSFALVSDSSQLQGYEIKRVSVRRLP